MEMSNLISSQQMLELLLNGAVLLQHLQVDSAEQEGEDDPVLMKHASSDPSVTSLKESRCNHVQPLRVVRDFAKIYNNRID